MSKETEYYVWPREEWDAKTCEKKAKTYTRDGLGTKHPWPGYIGGFADPYGYGKRRFNGGCIRNDKWYPGEEKPLPKVAEGFAIIRIATWGYRIVKRDKNGKLTKS